VNYRKQSSPSLDELRPENEYRLYAVCARYPQNLAQQMQMLPLQEGVYEVHGLGLRIRIIVLSQLPAVEHNAMLLLFSAKFELLRYGQAHYRPYSKDTSTLLLDLFKAYNEEADMSEKLKALFKRLSSS
jgi:hypothetical protein